MFFTAILVAQNIDIVIFYQTSAQAALSLAVAAAKPFMNIVEFDFGGSKTRIIAALIRVV